MSRSEEGGLPFEPAHSGSEAPREDQAAAGEVEECQEATLEPDAGASGDDSSRAMAAGAGADSLADSQEGDQPAAKEDCTAEPVPGSGQHKGASAAVSGASSGAELETAAGDRAQGAAEACAGSSGCGEERTSDAAADEQEHNGAAGEQPACASAAADEEGVEEGGAEEGSDAAAAAGEGEQQASEEREGPEAREQAEPSLDAQPAAAPTSAAGASATASAFSRRRLTKLTFSGPPKCLERRPRTPARSNFSHSQQRVRQILAANEALVRRLGDIACQPPEHERSQTKHDKFMANAEASSTKRRASEARRIMQQNLRIYQRLQEVQPSRDVARVAHEKDFARHEATLAALAALRGKGHGGWAK